jgi:hypothetical protein
MKFSIEPTGVIHIPFKEKIRNLSSIFALNRRENAIERKGLHRQIEQVDRLDDTHWISNHLYLNLMSTLWTGSAGTQTGHMNA